MSVTPGPSMLYVLSRSVGQSRAAGLASAAGLAMGGILLAVATAMGLAKVFSDFPAIVVILRYCGSAYLIWLGVTMIMNARSNAEFEIKAEGVVQKSYWTIVWQGVLVEVLNPKTVLFFALFLPPFVEISGGIDSNSNVQSQLLVLGILVPLTAVPSDTFVAYLGGTLTKNINHKQSFRERLGWAGGLILIAIAINLHFSFSEFVG